MFLTRITNNFFALGKKETLSSIVILSLLLSTNCFAKQFNFIVQPIFAPDKLRKIYQPLVQYLNKETGHTFKLITTESFLSYWGEMRKGEYDLILDAAHFTDYRIKNMRYTVLVKMPDTVSYSLITHENDLIFDHRELVGKRLVTLPPPSLGSVRLGQLFPNVARQPVISSKNSALDAINDVQNGKCFAALVPTPLLVGLTKLNTIQTTPPVPHMAISASPKINRALQIKIQRALINASKTERGKDMLKRLKIVGFIATNKKVYRGYEKLLSEVWGY